ncbi:MAG: PIG-L family deacetylase [Armatimonadetes bacterium]|nr:PIG-L family deacetylase [Armatimonadota bacterium]
MQLTKPGAEFFVPDGRPVDEALARTTHMGVGAHQDDLEIMAFDGILKCFHVEGNWFTGVSVTDGSGAPRADLYLQYTDEMMSGIRRVEQKKAAVIGDYGAQALLDFPSKEVKDASNPGPVADLKALIDAARPRVIYTHNLADKHDTHVAVTLRVIRALRELPAEARPEALYGCEVWRDLDWMIDKDKVLFDVAPHQNLAAALMGVFDSQVCGGKRYDLASIGRRQANATFFESHGVDETTHMIYGMDLTPLIHDPSKEPLELVKEHIDRFCAEVAERVGKFS